MNNFQSFCLPQPLLDSISRMEYTEPTPIQSEVIPLVLEGKDVMASSYTGSGKTGAFAISIIARIMKSERDSALILTPTRELAAQVMDIIKKLSGYKIRTALLIGGESIQKQFKELKNFPRIVVGTPGRVNDHLKRKSLKLGNCKFLVLDETDRMLDMGFGIQIDDIQKFLPSIKQTLLFSATIAKKIEQVAQKYLNNPVMVKINSSNIHAPKIKQENIKVEDDKKYLTLVKELDSREGSIVVFVATKISAQNIAEKLFNNNHNASAIHGDLIQRKRDRVIKSFRDKKCRIMVATDVASRGLDIDHIRHVINYDPPQLVEDYVHRIGRTARAGKSGFSLNLILNRDIRKWKEIDRFFSINAEEGMLRTRIKQSTSKNKRFSRKGKNAPLVMKFKKRSSGDSSAFKRVSSNDDFKKSHTGGNFKKSNDGFKSLSKKSNSTNQSTTKKPSSIFNKKRKFK